MVEPVTATAAASATNAATDMVSNAVSGVADSAGNWFTNAISAPFRWVASLPGQLVGSVTGAVKNVFSFGNIPLLGILAGALTFMKTVFPEGWRDALAMGSDKETATRRINEIAKDGVTGVAFDSAKQAAVLTAAISGITGAVEGGGLLAGIGLVGGAGFLAYKTLLAPESPAATPATTPVTAATTDKAAPAKT